MKTEKKLSELKGDQLDLSSIKGGRAIIKNALLNDSSRVPSIGANVSKDVSFHNAPDVKREEVISAGSQYPPKK